MAQFDLFLLTNRGQTNLTSYNAEEGRFNGLTFDEQLNVNTDTASLTFSMLKYRFENGQKILNAPTASITYGSRIRLLTNGQVFDFIVQQIAYNFFAENLQITFTCADLFQTIASKIGIGYTITSDINDPDFVGAQSIDDWARRIIRENNLDWSYIAVDEANDQLLRRLVSDEIIRKRDNVDGSGPEEWQELNDPYLMNLATNPATLNFTVSFSISNANAFSALKELAAQNEFIIKTNYTTRNIWFEPQKSWWFKGYYVDPRVNLEQLAINGNATNMATILNVTGPKDINDQEITLVPTFPASIANFIESQDWNDSAYYPQLYADHLSQNEAIQFIDFLRVIKGVPWLENRLINLDYLRDFVLLSHEYNEVTDILYNKLRKINGRLINKAGAYFKTQAEEYQLINDLELQTETACAAMYADLDTVYNTFVTKKDATPIIPIFDGDGYVIEIPGGYQLVDPGGFYGFIDYIPSGDEHYLRIPVESNKLQVLSNSSQQRTTVSSVNIALAPQNSPTSPISSTTIQLVGDSSINHSDFYVTSPLQIKNLETRLKEDLGKRQGLVDWHNWITTRAQTADSMWQLYLQNSANFSDYLAKYIGFYIVGRQVGVSNADNETLTDKIAVGQHFSTDNQYTLTADDVTVIRSGFQDRIPNRQDVINLAAEVATTLTQYWQNMRNAAVQLGIYLPSTWDCLDFLITYNSNNWSVNPHYYNNLLPLKKEGGQITLNPSYNFSVLPEQTHIPVYKYFNTQQALLSPIPSSNNTDNPVTTNTTVNYTPISKFQTIRQSSIFYTLFQTHQGVSSTTAFSDDVKDRASSEVSKLYSRQNYLQEALYNRAFTDMLTADAMMIILFVGQNNDSDSNVPILRSPLGTKLLLLDALAAIAYTKPTDYYTYQQQHNEIWQQLYAKYPTVFTEATYQNNDATNSYDLYCSAKAQLEALAQPEMQYTVQAVDIHVYNKDIMVSQLQLGDQIRIDYQDDQNWFSDVNVALRTNLYVTAIQHPLRTDGSYQYTVTTTRPTDIMIRRFAQVLAYK